MHFRFFFVRCFAIDSCTARISAEKAKILPLSASLPLSTWKMFYDDAQKNMKCQPQCRIYIIL